MYGDRYPSARRGIGGGYGGGIGGQFPRRGAPYGSFPSSSSSSSWPPAAPSRPYQQQGEWAAGSAAPNAYPHRSSERMASGPPRFVGAGVPSGPPLDLPQDWQCEGCQHLNFARRFVCQRCNGPRPSHQQLPSQQYHEEWRGNGPSVPRSGYPPPPQSSDTTDWLCENCQHINFAHRRDCQRCNAPRFAGKMQAFAPRRASEYPPDWRCIQCSNINFAKRASCKQCNAERTPDCELCEVGQQYAPDWKCIECQNVNFAKRALCKQCGADRTPECPIAYAPTHAVLKSKALQEQIGAVVVTTPSGKRVVFGAEDWSCPGCSFMNFAKRSECMQCGTAKPPLPDLILGQQQPPTTSLTSAILGGTLYNTSEPTRKTFPPQHNNGNYNNNRYCPY